MRESQEYGALVREKKINSVLKAKKMESSLSNGRKIFRLFLFLNEVTELHQLITNSTHALPLRMIKIVSTCCSFIYYLTDNIVWLANLGFVSSYVPLMGTRLKWKQIKNIFSLTKTILEVIISFISILEKRKKEFEISQRLLQFDRNTISWDSEAYVLFRELIITRRERNYHKVEATIYICRMFMLISGLRVSGYTYLDPIFISMCGVAQASCTVFKSMKGKSNYYKLTIEDVQQKQERKAKQTLLVSE